MIEEKSFYWKILDSLDTGIYFANRKRQITYWNKASEQMTGCKNNEVLGRCCKDNEYRHVDENGEPMCSKGCPLAQTLSSGQNSDTKTFLQDKKGCRIPVQIKVNPIFDNNNETIGAVAMVSHIS